MIQVLGLRPHTYKNGTTKNSDHHFLKYQWGFEKHTDVFDQSKIDGLIEKIKRDVGTDELYNLYFTAADCFEEKRTIKEQCLIPFDVDHIRITEDNANDAMQVARVCLDSIGIPVEECGVIFSGHGCQFFILSDTPILDREYFDSTKLHYDAICIKMNAAIRAAGLDGEMDTSMWVPAHLCRFPGTENRKSDQPIRKAIIVNSNLIARHFDITTLVDIKVEDKSERISLAALKNYPAADANAVTTGCKFLEHCFVNQKTLKEPEWYAMLCVLCHLPNGRELCHEYSRQYDGYSEYETDLKIDQALKAGPHFCKSINSRWGGCNTCPNNGVVRSPIHIRGPDYIPSEIFGFRKQSRTDSGEIKSGKPMYQDIVKKYGLVNPYKVIAETGAVYIFNGKHWQEMQDSLIEAWVAGTINNPRPMSFEVAEAVKQIRYHNVVPYESLRTNTEGFVNFNNCILNITNMERMPHSPDFGFVNVLPFNYDPNAKALRWELFLEEIMDGNKELANLLNEFAGYCILDREYRFHKMLVMIGTGENGKSVYMETLGKVAGDGNHSAVFAQNMQKETTLYLLVDKLFNYSEETSVDAFEKSEAIKAMSADGKIQVRRMYEQEMTVKLKTKLIFSANNVPYSKDKTHSLYRRLLIVNFTQEYLEGDPRRDPDLKLKLDAELPGIFNSMLIAYKRVMDTKTFSAHKETKAAVADYKHQNDPLARFVEECVNFDSSKEVEVSVAEVYDEYKKYCEDSSEKWENKVSFGMRLKKILRNLEPAKQKKIGGKNVKVYKHIILHEKTH